MSRIFIAGMGAVSPAGWTVAALREALEKGESLPTQLVERPGWEKPLRMRLVPNPATRPEFLAHPRLRRTSPIAHYVVATALEATTALRANQKLKHRLGLVVCLQSGCVNYSCRFFDETLKDPATASPLLFPETVYAAPASHVAAVLENVTLASTLVGDPASFLQGVAVGVQWLEEDRVDACLVIGAEETNWILADALWRLERSAVLTAGAGALCLCREVKLSSGVELAAITDAQTYSSTINRTQAARAMREQLDQSTLLEPGRAELPLGPAARQRRPTIGHGPDAHPPLDVETSQELLCDGIGNNPRTDAPELAAWRDWTGQRISLKHILGEGLMAAAAWQCVAACDAVGCGRFDAANVSLVGSNQQAMGARFTGISRLSAGNPWGNIRS